MHIKRVGQAFRLNLPKINPCHIIGQTDESGKGGGGGGCHLLYALTGLEHLWFAAKYIHNSSTPTVPILTLQWVGLTGCSIKWFLVARSIWLWAPALLWGVEAKDICPF